MAYTGNFSGARAAVNAPASSLLGQYIGKHIVNKKIGPFPTSRKNFYQIGSPFRFSTRWPHSPPMPASAANSGN